MTVVGALLAALAAALMVGRPRGRPLPRRPEQRSGGTGRPSDPDGLPGGLPGGVPGGVPGPSAGVPVGVRAALALGAGAAVLMVLPGTVGLVASLVAAAVGWWRSGSLEPASARRRRELLEAELPHLVDLMLATVAVGAAPAEALSRVTEVATPPVRAELAVWVQRLGLGADPVRVWHEMSQHPQLGRLGRTLRRSAESGAPVVQALEHLAEDLRARRRTDVETQVRQVEVRAAVPLGVCLLPAFVLVGVVPLVVGAATGFLGAGW